MCPTIPAPMRLPCDSPILAPMRCFCPTKVFGASASVSPVSQSCDRASALNQQKCTSHKNKNADRKRLFLFPVLATGVRLWPSTIVSVRPSPLVCQTVSVRPSPLFSFFSFFSKWLTISKKPWLSTSKKPLGFFSTPENKQGSFLIPKPNNTREWRNPKSARGTIAYYTANLNAKLFYSCLVSKLHQRLRPQRPAWGKNVCRLRECWKLNSYSHCCLFLAGCLICVARNRHFSSLGLIWGCARGYFRRKKKPCFDSRA